MTDFKTKLQQFVVAKSNLVQDLLKDKDDDLNQDSSMSEDVVATMPPIEAFMDLSASDARQHFFQCVQEKDVVLGEVSAIEDRGLLIKLLTLTCGNTRDLEPLRIMAFCPLRELPRVNHEDPLDMFQHKDKVRAMVHLVSKEKERVFLSMLERSLPSSAPEDLKLGLIGDDDLPLHYKRISRIRGRSFTEMLQETVEFNNPGTSDHLCRYLGVDDSKPHSFLKQFNRLVVPESECAVALQKEQASSWAIKSVQDGVSFFRAGKQVEALQCLNKALQIHPESVDALVARGALHANTEVFPKAIQDFEEALRLQPRHRNARKYLAETLTAQGQALEEKAEVQNAIHNYRRAVRLMPGHEAALERLKALLKSKTHSPSSSPSARRSRRDSFEFDGRHVRRSPEMGARNLSPHRGEEDHFEEPERSPTYEEDSRRRHTKRDKQEARNKWDSSDEEQSHKKSRQEEKASSPVPTASEVRRMNRAHRQEEERKVEAPPEKIVASDKPEESSRESVEELQTKRRQILQQLQEEVKKATEAKNRADAADREAALRRSLERRAAEPQGLAPPGNEPSGGPRTYRRSREDSVSPERTVRSVTVAKPAPVPVPPPADVQPPLPTGVPPPEPAAAVPDQPPSELPDPPPLPVAAPPGFKTGSWTDVTEDVEKNGKDKDSAKENENGDSLLQMRKKNKKNKKKKKKRTKKTGASSDRSGSRSLSPTEKDHSSMSPTLGRKKAVGNVLSSSRSHSRSGSRSSFSRSRSRSYSRSRSPFSRSFSRSRSRSYSGSRSRSRSSDRPKVYDHRRGRGNYRGQRGFYDNRGRGYNRGYNNRGYYQNNRGYYNNRGGRGNYGYNNQGYDNRYHNRGSGSYDRNSSRGSWQGGQSQWRGGYKGSYDRSRRDSGGYGNRSYNSRRSSSGSDSEYDSRRRADSGSPIKQHNTSAAD